MSNRIRGITVEIGGDTTKLSKALEGVNKNIKNTQTQLKDVEKLLKLDPTNTELLSQKQRLLADAVSSTSDKLETLKKSSEQAAKTKDNYDAWKAKYAPIKQKIGETETKLKDLKEQAKTADEHLSKGEISQEKYDALQKEIKETTDELTSLKESAKAVSDEFVNPISPQQYDSLQREIVETQQELQNLQRETENSRTALIKIGEAGTAMEKVGDKISGAGEKLLPLTAGITALGTMAVKTTADFDAVMSKVSAVSGATGEDLDALRAKAREMGAQTKFSASEAGEALNYMAMAGWKTEDMLGGIEGIMNIAAASGEDLATTDTLTALGMSADDSAHFADILAAASSNANTNVSLMGESFKYVAPVAGAMGASAEDLSIALGLMANSGIKGSPAGNSLKNALAQLLMKQEIDAPGGGKKWYARTIESILTNEKYKGSALLQKKFTVDFLTKKQKINEGEVPQYFVEHSHPPIIDPEEFELVQAEITRRKTIGRVYSSSNIFSTKLICSCCGGYFGSKVWHSTSKYRKIIWQCNHKFSNGEKCNTPHLYEDAVKEKFIEVCGIINSDKADFLMSCQQIRNMLSDCTALDEKIHEQYVYLNELAAAMQNFIKENAMSQTSSRHRSASSRKKSEVMQT